MKKKTEQILMEHFNDHFGKLIAEMLLREKLKNVKNLESLSLKEKIDVGDKFIDQIFKKFYNEDKLKNIHILYLLRFSLNEAIDKIESMIKKDSEITIGHLEDVNSKMVIDMNKNISKEENFSFGFEISNILDGVLMFNFEKEIITQFGFMMMELIMGEKPTDYELDDMKISAINEFFNILLPSFSKVIGDQFNTDIFYVPVSYDDYKSKYFKGDEFIIPQSILQTEINMRIGSFKMQGIVYFIITKTGEAFGNLVKGSTQDAKDPWEQDPPEIVVKKSGTTQQDLSTLFKMLDVDPSEIQAILKEINKNDLNLDATDVIAFNKIFVDKFLPNISNNKRETIRTNLEHLFNIKE